MKQITIMFGLPRSGKTTYIKNNNNKDVVISADTIRLLVYNQRFWSDGEPLVWYIRGIMLKNLLQQGSDIIIDETNTTIKRREAIIKLAKQYGYTINCVVIDCPAEECKERAIIDNQKDLIPIIESMAKGLEYPDISEGIDNIIYEKKDMECI